MKQPNFNLLYSVAGLAACTSVISSCQQKKEITKPYNIVYIMTDDHTAQMMSCYDTRYIETPNLDRIANDGVRFTNSFVANSLSGPSRACMITGKHSHANGFTDNTTCVFDGSQQTMPKLLQKAGYQTAIVGKWHLESLPTGFDYWEIVPGQGDYYNPDFITMNNDTIQKQGYITNIVTDMGIDWMENQRDRNKPFCLFIHHKAIHRNWLPETKYLAEYEEKTFPLPDNFFDTYEGRPAAASQEMSIFKDMDLIYDLKMLKEGKESSLKERYLSYIGRMNPEERKAFDDFYAPIITDFYKQNLKGKELAEWKYQRYMRDYAKTVKSLDDNVGRVLDYLKEHDMLDNTLVVYTSDQGFYMGEHGWFDKRYMQKESLNMPLLIRYPNEIKPGSTNKSIIINADFAPTLLDYAGISKPSYMQGESFRSILKNGKEPKGWRDAMYYRYWMHGDQHHHTVAHYGICTERYKLIYYYGKTLNKKGTHEMPYTPDWELFDMKRDPQEMRNFYNDKRYRKVVADLKEKLYQLKSAYQDNE